MTGLCPPSCQRCWMDSTAPSLPMGRQAPARLTPWRAATGTLWMGRTSQRWLVSTTSMPSKHVHQAARWEETVSAAMLSSDRKSVYGE